MKTVLIRPVSRRVYRWCRWHAVVCVAVLLTAMVSSEAARVHQWDFSPAQWQSETELTAVQGGLLAVAEQAVRIEDDSLVLDGANSLTVPGVVPDHMPRQAFSVEALVQIDTPTRWGGILGFLQDNGSYEKGWLLGYQNDRYTLQVSTGTSLVTLTSTTSLARDRWVHLVGTYDGTSMHLYVDGRAEASGEACRGDIAYPPHAFYTLGAYRDDNEFYRANGRLRLVSLYDHALRPAEVTARHRQSKALRPLPLSFSVKPSLRYTAPDAAVVEWESSHTGQGVLVLGKTDRPDSSVPASSPEGRIHRVVLSDLEPGTVYFYRLGVRAEGLLHKSPLYSFDTTLNYLRHPLPVAERGMANGVALVLGLDDSSVMEGLVRKTPWMIIGLDPEVRRVTAVREHYYKAGLYGTRVQAHVLNSSVRVPVAGNSMNRIVWNAAAPDAVPPVPAVDVCRLLAPGGEAVLTTGGSGAKTVLDTWATARPVSGCTIQWEEQGGRVRLRLVKDALPGSGSWTHQYGDLGNTANSGERLAGATAAEDFLVQWVGRPGADFGIDRNPRMPAPLAAAGRLFHQGMNRIIALDAANGTVLWHLEAPDLRRVNIPRDAANWCTDDEHLFVVVKDRAWVLDHATGERMRTLPLPGVFATSHEWGYVAQDGELLIGSAVARDAPYTAYWSGAMWYDKTDENATAKVCSDALFAYGKQDGRGRWMYRRGKIINTTICGAGGRLHFVECRHPDVVALTEGRIQSPQLWEQQVRVTLDLATGEILHEQPIDTEDGRVVFFGACTPETMLLVASHTKQYHLYAYDTATGDLRWQQSHAWPGSDHSGHMQHPVLLDDVVYLQPWGYRLADGERLPDRMGAREGCHTYVGGGDALIYRGTARRLAVWNRTTGAISSWMNLRPSCWISVIPAEGMLLVPEGGGGCSCGNWMETSLVFTPRVIDGTAEGSP